MAMLDGPNMTAALESEREDVALEKHHDHGLHESCERATFHRREAEKWERIGRAHAAALRELNSASPVEDVTPGMLHGAEAMVPG